MFKSISLVPTGRYNSLGDPRVPEGCILGADGQILEPRSVNSALGHDLRNANGDVNDSSMGYQIAIDTMTYIKKQITEQLFYEVDLSEYIPFAVGEGAFAANILTNVEFSNADDFESGNIRSGESGSRLAVADSSVASKTQKVITWAKQIGYTIVDVQQALMANNWDFIAGKERARKRNWDLGIQRIAFLGSKSDTAVTGLLNNGNVTVDTTTITKLVSSMTAAETDTFVRTLIAAYRAAVNYSRYPDRFVIPEDDFLALPSMVPNVIGTGSGTYPVSRITYLEEAFRKVCGAGFRIIPTAYGIPANNPLNEHLYALYKHDPESLKMELPVNYTATAPNSINNFSFQNVGYGQYSGVGVFRNLELVYFRF